MSFVERIVSTRYQAIIDLSISICESRRAGPAGGSQIWPSPGRTDSPTGKNSHREPRAFEASLMPIAGPPGPSRR
jgi:hypothetical protein